jgi:phosphatidylglycerol:prolipoprotein diacylglycerol transferase
VIHEWGACGIGEPCYSQNLLKIVLPPYAGLGLFGGVLGAAIAILIYCRWKKLPLWIALDAVIPGTLLAQGIARWGNFFNQELYGPPTSAPWGIAIECVHRIAPWFCPGDPNLPAGAASYPFETTGFHPLFFYESALDILGAVIAILIVARFLRRGLKPADVAAFWCIWYGTTRAFLETFREGWNWTLGGLATAQWIGIGLVIFGIALLVWNHRPGTRPYEYLPAWVPPARAAPPIDDDEADYYADDDADEGPDDGADEADDDGADYDGDDATDRSDDDSAS